MMKKFFDKVRRWLIKKLGGYTEQFPPIAPVEIKTYTRNVETLCWECAVPMGMYLDTDRAQQVQMFHQIDCAAKEKLADELFNRGFVNVQTASDTLADPLADKRRRYTILVARP